MGVSITYRQASDCAENTDASRHFSNQRFPFKAGITGWRKFALSFSKERAKTLLFFIAVGGVAAFFTYKQVTQIGDPGVVSAGQPAPEFALKNEQGGTIRLSDYRGKLVFLHFWASWCASCITEAQDLEVLANAMRGKPFQMVAVSIDIDADDVLKFDERNNVTLPALLDPGQQIARGFYKITGPPETFLISPGGIVLKHIVGPLPWSHPQVLAVIESMLPDAY